MAETRTAEKPATVAAKPDLRTGDISTFVQESRLPYHSALKDRLGITRADWQVLTEAIFPGAKTPEAIFMALAYCRRRNLDIFKRPVHIVPMYSSALRKTVETVWPGISELRTTAQRTREFGGCDAAEEGPTFTREFFRIATRWEGPEGNRRKVQVDEEPFEVAFPEWTRLTVYRLGPGGMRMAVVGPKVYWEEIYATASHDSKAPNERWTRSPFGQNEKCAEAGALRRGFAEEIGGDYAVEEMEGKTIEGVAVDLKEHVPAAELTPEAMQAKAAEAAAAASRPTEPAEDAKAAHAPADAKDGAIDVGAFLDSLATKFGEARTGAEVDAIWSDAQAFKDKMPPGNWTEAVQGYESTKQIMGGGE